MIYEKLDDLLCAKHVGINGEKYKQRIISLLEEEMQQSGNAAWWNAILSDLKIY